jgi:predicted nucleotide-binding protein (sugar kinase/HSP70/actin superfamily)
MRVGIPRALLYHRYGPFWERFLGELGVDVVVSRRTDKALVEQGIGRVPSEVCLPIKIAAGHICDLSDKVDAVFLPRLLWLGDRMYACPKMIGIVDFARMILGSVPRLIAPVIRGAFDAPHFLAGIQLTHNPVRAARALAVAMTAMPAVQRAPDFPKGERRIGLISHFYNLGDDYISAAIVDTVRGQGYRICTKDELSPVVLRDGAGLAGEIRWTYERELYNAFRYLVGRVDGICMLVSMGCGPDSLIGEFMRREATETDVPFLQLVIDEHTGTAGLVTRVEAFLELAGRRRQLAAR